MDDTKLDNSSSQEGNSFSEDKILDVVKNYLQSSAFTDRKLTDDPTDDYAVVNRKYITSNGTFANRPTGTLKGQFYFATDLATNGKSCWNNGTNWIDATGSILGATV